MLPFSSVPLPSDAAIVSPDVMGTRTRKRGDRRRRCTRGRSRAVVGMAANPLAPTRPAAIGLAERDGACRVLRRCWARLSTPRQAGQVTPAWPWAGSKSEGARKFGSCPQTSAYASAGTLISTAPAANSIDTPAPSKRSSILRRRSGSSLA